MGEGGRDGSSPLCPPISRTLISQCVKSQWTINTVWFDHQTCMSMEFMEIATVEVKVIIQIMLKEIVHA